VILVCYTFKVQNLYNNTVQIIESHHDFLLCQLNQGEYNLNTDNLNTNKYK